MDIISTLHYHKFKLTKLRLDYIKSNIIPRSASYKKKIVQIGMLLFYII